MRQCNHSVTQGGKARRKMPSLSRKRIYIPRPHLCFFLALENTTRHVTSGIKLSVLHKAHSVIVLAVYVKYHESRGEGREEKSNVTDKVAHHRALQQTSHTWQNTGTPKNCSRLFKLTGWPGRHGDLRATETPYAPSLHAFVVHAVPTSLQGSFNGTMRRLFRGGLSSQWLSGLLQYHITAML